MALPGNIQRQVLPSDFSIRDRIAHPGAVVTKTRRQFWLTLSRKAL
jgi:hypothetical protein